MKPSACTRAPACPPVFLPALAENMKNLGSHTIQLQTVLNESGANTYAGHQLPCHKIKFFIHGEWSTHSSRQNYVLQLLRMCVYSTCIAAAVATACVYSTCIAAAAAHVCAYTVCKNLGFSSSTAALVHVVGSRDSAVVEHQIGWITSRSGGRIYFSRVNFLCSLLFRCLFHSCVTAVHKRSQSFCQKCRWQVTA